MKNGYGWLYSGSVSTKAKNIVFIGKDWGDGEQTKTLDLSKLCSRKNTQTKPGDTYTGLECKVLGDEKDINKNFTYVNKTIDINEKGTWSSPFQHYQIKFKKGNNQYDNLWMWSNGDLNSGCLTLTYKWNGTEWKDAANNEKAWIDKTTDYFSSQQQTKQSCQPIQKN